MSNILRLEAVKARTGLSKTTIYEMMGRDDFPQCVHISARCVGWIEDELLAWVTERSARRAASIPAYKRS